MPSKKSTKAKTKNGNGATLGIENELWEAADKLRGHLDAAEYKSVVLGLIFLKYISDMFEQVRERVEKEGLDDPEDRDVYLVQYEFLPRYHPCVLNHAGCDKRLLGCKGSDNITLSVYIKNKPLGKDVFH